MLPFDIQFDMKKFKCRISNIKYPTYFSICNRRTKTRQEKQKEKQRANNQNNTYIETNVNEPIGLY